MDTLRRIASGAGLTVIATLHHVEFARRYADRIVGFRAGRVVFDGLPAELTDRAAERVFGPTDPAPPAPLAAPAGQPSWAVS
jgi:phosphonate transport system ATP-binding protein